MAIDDKKWAEIKYKWASAAEERPEKPKADFKKDLKKGQNAEHDFFMKYQQHLTRTDGRRGDFIINKTEEVLELKADFYNPENTPNFFMELYSYKEEPGGVFQAKEHGVKYYAYWFINSDSLYLFNVDQLIKRLTKIMPKLEKKFIKNKSHITTGYLVERGLLLDICLDPAEVILNGK